jgi:hypothetical protein
MRDFRENRRGNRTRKIDDACFSTFSILSENICFWSLWLDEFVLIWRIEQL